jgi:alpha-beta hydrolase superfamily lysophospholipase
VKAILIALGSAVALAAVALGLLLWLAQPAEPTSFYAPPDEVPAEPGTLIRQEPYARGVPEGAEAWLILYSSTSPDGAPVAVSGVVMAPADPPPGPRPVIAWSHGTRGVATGCAPTLGADPFLEMPALAQAPARGWVVTATDYPGLGTPGPHPYLDGISEGRSVLDSVRAASQIDGGPELSPGLAVWGISQGGHSALFAGEIAPSYAPELDVAGVAVAAPATDLAGLLAGASGAAGKVLTAEAVYAWSRVYPELSFDEAIVDRAERAARLVARSCLDGPSRFLTAAGAALLPERLLAFDVTEDPRWAARIRRNTPTGPIAAPLFVGQGDADTIVLPEVTLADVRRRCAAGERVELARYPGATHFTVPAPAGPDLLGWTAERFAGRPVPEGCRGI